MYSKLRPLDAKHCAEHGLKRFANFGFARAQTRAPVVSAELGEAVAVYPLAFQAIGQGGLQLVALLGLHADDNLFVNAEGHWRGVYIPAWFRSYPFMLGRLEVQGQRRSVHCFDQDSGLYRERPDPEQGEERFFDSAGELQPSIVRVLEFLKQTAVAAESTQRAVNALIAADVLVRWELPVQNPDPGRALPDDLYRVDTQAVRGLTAEALASLNQVDALVLAHAQMLSTWRVKALVRLEQAVRRGQEKTDVALDGLLDEQGDGAALNFDWADD